MKNEENYKFLTKLMLQVGAIAPPSAFLEAALVEVAREHHLLGESATASMLEARVGVYRRCNL